MGDYHDLYLTTDTLLLCDIFENWRNISLRGYGLDPAAFPTAPSLSWNAAFKMTGITLELLTDIEMLNFIDKGLFIILFIRQRKIK